jgi:outer membrane protein OmpA-like peptidoglycan-associated protein
VNTPRIGLAFAMMCICLGPGALDAQSVPVDRFTLGIRSDDAFHAARLGRIGHGRFGVSVAADYASEPLVIESDGETELVLIDDHLSLHANLSLSLVDRLVLFAGVRATAIMEGEAVPRRYRRLVESADGAGFGDAIAGLRLRLAGSHDGPFGVGLQALVTLPTADVAEDLQRYTGENTVTVTPELILEFRAFPVLTVTVNAGAHIRENEDFLGTTLGDELRYGLAVGVRPIETLELIAEGYGAFTVQELGDRGNTALEWLGGLKWHHGSGFSAGLAAGTGIRPGYGTPSWRVLLMLGLLTIGELEEPIDIPPDVPPLPRDSDDDGIADPSDRCPKEAEDIDSFEDDDGCPDLDNDQDSVPDRTDACRDDPEDIDQYEDADGCADRDNDGDGLDDANDRCPTAAEDADLYEDSDGCPDPDNDKDGVVDTADSCPNEPGTVEERGCPKAIRVEQGVIRLLQQIKFANNSDVILGESNSIMDELRAAMQANTRIAHVRVEGHTDDRGPNKRNLALSKKRAASVVRWLAVRGIDTSRLEAWGCGEIQPIDSNKTNAGRANNRRVVFHITDPAPPQGAVPPAPGCESAGQL